MPQSPTRVIPVISVSVDAKRHTIANRVGYVRWKNIYYRYAVFVHDTRSALLRYVDENRVVAQSSV